MKYGGKLRVIVCGGDGSVMFVIEELMKFNCNFDNLAIGIIPFGTGNDFARSLGNLQLIYFDKISLNQTHQ